MSNYREDKIKEYCKIYNVKLEKDDYDLLLNSDYDDLQWILSYMKNNEVSLARVLVSYNGDWSTAQGNRGW